MVFRKNFSGLHTPKEFGMLPVSTVPAVTKPAYAPIGIRVVPLDIADPAYDGRWIVSTDRERGWRLCLREFRDSDGEVVFTHYLAEREIAAGDRVTPEGEFLPDRLAPDAEYVSDFQMTDLPVLSDRSYYQCNFTQPAPNMSGPTPVGVRLWPGDDAPMTFVRCNMLNCEPPPGSTLTKCLTALKSFGLPGTAEAIEIDGVIIHTHQARFNRVHGRREPDGSYVYDQQDEAEE